MQNVSARKTLVLFERATAACSLWALVSKKRSQTVNFPRLEKKITKANEPAFLALTSHVDTEV